MTVYAKAEADQFRTCKVVRETPKALRLRSSDGSEEWFPKSRIEFDTDLEVGDETEIGFPQWLLDKKDWD